MTDRESNDSVRTVIWAHLGRVAYAPAHALQKRLRDAIHRDQGPEYLLTLEHDPPVFTLGRNAGREDVTASDDWLDANRIEIHESDRGGQVTYHGPGQLVAYPILDLDPDRRDVRRYVQDLEHVIIETLSDVGVDARVREGQSLIGVWTGDESSPRKIASIGVHLAHWITNHGFALNVSNDLDHFSGIVACGLNDVTMTSIENETGQHHTIQSLATRVAGHIARTFARRIEIASDEDIRALVGVPRIATEHA